MKTITKIIKRMTEITSLVILVTLVSSVHKVMAADASFTKTACTTSADISTDVLSKNSLQAMLMYYDWELDSNMRFCQNSITLQGSNNLINLTKPIEIKATPNSGALTFGGADPKNPITLNAEGIQFPAAKPDKNGNMPQNCAIKITGSNITLQNIILLKAPGTGICVGSDELASQPSKIEFDNVVVSRSKTGDGFRVADGAKNITFGPGTEATYNNNGYGIEFLGDMNGATSSDIYYKPSDPYSVSLFQNKQAFKTGEQKVLQFANVFVSADQITGNVQSCSADGTSCVPAPIVGLLIHRVYSQSANDSNIFSSFVGVARPNNNISGTFILKFDSTLASLLGDKIELIPIWSESDASNSGKFTVLGSSSKYAEVKFGADLSADLNTNVATGTTTQTQNPPVKGFTCDGSIIDNYKSFLTLVQLPNGQCYPVLADRLHGFTDTTACKAFVAAMQTNPANSGVLISVDSDFDGIPDAKEDRNHNCIPDPGESDWSKPDSDSDGITDWEESGDKGYMTCYQNRDKVCSKGTDGSISCTDSSLNAIVLEMQNPAEGKKGKAHFVTAFIPDKDAYGAACETTAQNGCANATHFISIDTDPTKRGRPVGFSVANGDFCTQTDPSNADSDNDGLSDGREQRGALFNPLAKSHLYTLDGAPYPKSATDSTPADCTLDAAASDRNLGAGREVVQQPTTALHSDGTTEPITINLICMSDSLALDHFRNRGLPDQTDPLNPDTDGDGWCDGSAGNKVNSACTGMKGADNCPLTSDPDNKCVSDCVANNVYNYIDPNKKTALIAAIKNFKVSPTSGVDARVDLANQLKAIDPKGDPNKDSDGDGIPDLVEDPDGLCLTPTDVNTQSTTGTIYTDPFNANTDGDTENDSHDPCPRDNKDTCVIDNSQAATPGTCAKNVTTSYVNQLALYAFMDWDKDNLYNTEENPSGNPMSINSASGDTCPDVADSDGDLLNDFYERQFKTNPWVKDTDGDGLTDYQEVNMDGNPTSLNVKLMTGQVGCYEGYVDTDSKFAITTFSVGQALKGDTDPLNRDTDGDGIPDGVEALVAGQDPSGHSGTNPLNPDSDGDGLCDGSKDVPGVCIPGEDLLNSNQYPKFPKNAADANNPDALSAALHTGFTYLQGPDGTFSDTVYSSNPCSADTDHDAVLDGAEQSQGQNKLDKRVGAGLPSQVYGDGDTDGDGIPNKIEIALDTDPNIADTDGDGLPDGCINIGKDDGINSMKGELCSHFINGKPDFDALIKSGKHYDPNQGDTDPTNPDTDHDGMKDGDELSYPDGLYKSPYQTDANGKKTFVGFYQKGVNLNPLKPDTDGDGILDGIEAGGHFKNNGIGTCKDSFCCGQNGVDEIKAEEAIPGAFTTYGSPFYTVGTETFAADGLVPGGPANSTGNDSDGDGLLDGNISGYIGRGTMGEDLNCNGMVDLDANGNPTEPNPRLKDSNGDGISDSDALHRNGVFDMSNLPYVYARQVGSGCSNTLLPGETLPATAGDVVTLLMMLSPLGFALRMRFRKAVKK